MEKIILEKDVILPNKETIEVYNLGTAQQPRYIVTEQTVRKELSTHKLCGDCGSTIEKNSYCHSCYESKNKDNYLKKEFKEWDGKTPLIIYNSDEYFFDEDSLLDYIEEAEEDNIQLMICTPNHCPELSEEYFTEEYLPENFDDLGDFDKSLVQKIKELNEYISTLKPMSWSQGRYRTEYRFKSCK